VQGGKPDFADGGLAPCFLLISLGRPGLNLNSLPELKSKWHGCHCCPFSKYSKCISQIEWRLCFFWSVCI